MKKITNLLYAAFVAVLSAGFISCEETAPVYEPGSQDLEGCYGVYFPTQTAAGEHTLDPTAAKEMKVVVMRQNAEDSITVPVNAVATIDGVPVAVDSIFKVPAVVFEDGQLEDTITVTFPNVETAVKYGLTLEVTDPAYASLFGSNPVSLSFSIFCVEWKYVAVDEDGNQSFVTDESKAATVKFTQGFWGEVVEDVKIKYYEVNGVLHCVAYRDGDSFFPETDVPVDFNFTMKAQPNGEGKYDIDVKKQYMGWDYDAGVSVYFYDVYNWLINDGGYDESSWAGPDDFYAKNGASNPRCYYDGMGGYYFNLKYMVPALGQGMGFSAPQYDLVGLVNGVLRLDFTTRVNVGETVDGVAPVTFTMAKDVASVKYTILEGEVTDKVAKAYCDSIISDTISRYAVATPENATVALELAASGVYTLVAVPFDAEGVAQQPAKDVNYLAVPFTYVAKDEADKYAAVVTLGVEETSGVYAKDGYTNVNSFAYYVYGKDIVEAKSLVFPTEDYAVNPDSCNALVAADGEAFGEEALALINGAGMSDLVKGLKPLTSYTIVLWANNGYRSTVVAEEYTTSGLAPELLGTGTYTYTCMLNLVDPGYSFYKDPNYKDTYKIANWFYGVDFTFTWDGDSIVKVADQFSGYVHAQYGNVNVMELSDYAGKEMSPSYYDADTKTFYFGVIYYIDGGYFGMGYETFTLDAEDAEGGEEAAVRGRHSIINSTPNTQWGVRTVKSVGPQIAGMAVERATSKIVEFTAKAMEKVQYSKTVSKQKFVVK
ncbi:MAG: hypothetical protein E7091_04715 [Bacteroidales bacterium]|nr:hypothetical protein [Bacteroidales bacterium]